MITSLIVDGTVYPVAAGVTRIAEVVSSNISGEMMDGHYLNDVQGTRFVYTVVIAVPIGSESSYHALYEILTNPVAEHTFILPYGAQNKSIKGRCTGVRDTHVKQDVSGALWRATSFTIVSNYLDKEA